MSNLCSTCLLRDDQLSTVSPELLSILTNLLQSSQFNYKLNGKDIKICTKCNSTLEDMSKFRDTALKNLEYLNSVIENAPKLISKVKFLKIKPVTDLRRIVKKPIKAKKIVKKETVIPPLPPNMVTPVVDMPPPEPIKSQQTVQVINQQTIHLPHQTMHEQHQNMPICQDMSMNMGQSYNQLGNMGNMGHMDMGHMSPMSQMMMPVSNSKIEITINPETKLEYANLQPSMMTQAGVSGMHSMHSHIITTNADALNTQIMIHPEMKSNMSQQQEYHQLHPAQQHQQHQQQRQQQVEAAPKNDKDFGKHYLENQEYFIKVLSNDEVLQRMELKRRKKEFVSAKHKCKHCVIIFKNGEQAKAHQSECHDECRGRFQCFICTRRFRSMVSMNKHISLHCTNLWVCSKCGFESVDKRSLQTHICKRVRAKKNLNLNYGKKLTKC